jgi:hypothetical protein
LCLRQSGDVFRRKHFDDMFRKERFVSALLYVQWCMKSGGMWHLWKMVATEAKIYFGGLDRLEPG